jgi:hypothetical protein
MRRGQLWLFVLRWLRLQNSFIVETIFCRAGSPHRGANARRDHRSSRRLPVASGLLAVRTMHLAGARSSCLRRVFKHAGAIGAAMASVLLLCAKAAAQLRFVAEGPDAAQIMLIDKYTIYDPIDAQHHLRSEDLCRAPCSPELLPGTHDLALKKGYDRSSFSFGSVVIPDGPATIHGTITSRRGLRIGLIVGGAISWAAGQATLLTGVLTGDGKNAEVGVGVGVPLLAVGVSAYVVGMVIRDSAHIEVLPGIEPVAVVRLPTAGLNETQRQASGAPAGLTLRVQF